MHSYLDPSSEFEFRTGIFYSRWLQHSFKQLASSHIQSNKIALGTGTGPRTWVLNCLLAAFLLPARVCKGLFLRTWHLQDQTSLQTCNLPLCTSWYLTLSNSLELTVCLLDVSTGLLISEGMSVSFNWLPVVLESYKFFCLKLTLYSWEQRWKQSYGRNF